MVVRRGAMAWIGPFNAHLGPRARFPAGEEDDYSYRALAARYAVAQTPDLYVEHYGFRDYASGAAARHRRGYDYGYGTVLMKIARLRDLYAPVWMALHLVYGLECSARLTGPQRLRIARLPVSNSPSTAGATCIPPG